MNNRKIYLAIASINDMNYKAVEPLPDYYQKKYTTANQKERNVILTTCYLLNKYLHIDSSISIKVNVYGKPYVDDLNYYFNISHSGQYVVLAFSKEEVGVDIENIDAIPLIALKRVLNTSEYQMLKRKEKDKDYLILKGIYWTKVEALLKAQGTGFYLDPRENDSYDEGWHTLSIVYQREYVITCASQSAFKIQRV